MTIYNNLENSMPVNPVRFYCKGSFQLDLEHRQVILNHKLTPLPPCAFDFLLTLLRHYPEPVSYKTLVGESNHRKLSELDAQDLSRLNVYLLRRAIEPDIMRPRYILTVAGFGYRIAV